MATDNRLLVIYDTCFFHYLQRTACNGKRQTVIRLTPFYCHFIIVLMHIDTLKPGTDSECSQTLIFEVNMSTLTDNQQAMSHCQSWQQNCKFIVLGHNNFCCGVVYIHFFPWCDCSMKNPIFSISSFAFLCIWKLHKVTGPKRVTSHFLSLFLLYEDKSSCTLWTKIQVDFYYYY